MTISEKELLAYNEWTNNNLERLRYEYDLNEKSVCLDVGAFHCDWSIAISNKYNNPTIYAFEILKDNYELGKNNIQQFPNIMLFNYGVGSSNQDTIINIGETDRASTSLFIDGGNTSKVSIKSIKDIIIDLHINTVDVMKLNVEGSEYDILECMIENDLHLLVKNFQIQFHKLGNNYLDRYENIRNALSKSHYTTYDFYFVWEGWALK